MRDPSRADATATEIAAAVRDGAVSARAVVDAALARIARLDPAVNAFTALCATRARERAAALDAKRDAGQSPGDLAGVPFAVKAMIDVAGLATTGGSGLYRDAPPAARDAAVVQALEAAGAICVGALNMDEFGMGGTTQNACFGPTRNPHDLARTPGGSSGGSAAAVAAGMVPLAIGSDALGSIRLPASLCGVFGLRPTRGTIDDAGVLGGGGTLATLGPLARSSDDIALCHRVVARRGDARTMRAPGADDAIRIASAGGYFARGLDDDVREVLERTLGALRITRVVDYPQPRRAKAAAQLVNAAESVVGKLEALRTRPERFDPATRDRFLAHALMPAQWYLAAQCRRRAHAAQVLRMFDDIDVLVLPATPCTAPPIGVRTLRVDGVELPTGPALGWFTQPVAGTDCPALTVPVARGADRLPLGVQLMARRHREDLLFGVAARLEALGVAASPLAEVPVRDAERADAGATASP